MNWPVVSSTIRECGSRRVGFATVGASVGILWILAAAALLGTGERPELWSLLVERGKGQAGIVGLGLVFAFAVTASDAESVRLQYAVLLPVPRSSYYLSRLAGRAAFVALVWGIASGGIAVLTRALGVLPPPGSITSLFTVGLPLLSIVASVSALAILIRHRFLALLCWVGLYVAVEQAAVLRSDTSSVLVRLAVAPLVEVVGPFLVGPTEQYRLEAILGPWYAWRCVTQWAFGALLAAWAGSVLFRRLEIGGE